MGVRGGYHDGQILSNRRLYMRGLSAAILMVVCCVSARAENLLDVFHLARDSDPALQGADAARRAAQAAQDERNTLFKPRAAFDATTSYTRQEILNSSSRFVAAGVSEYNNQQLGVSLNQPLFHQDYDAQIRQASAQTLQAEAEYVVAEQDLSLRVSQRYFNVLAAADDVNTADAELQAIDQQLQQAKRRFEVGLIAITDVHEAQARFDAAQAAKIDAQNKLSAAREALAEITGRAPDTLALLANDAPLTPVEPADIEHWVRTATDTNPRLVAARAAVEAAHQAVEVNRHSDTPTLEAVASHNYTNLGGGNLGSRETQETTLGLQFKYPFYQGGAVDARLRGALERETQARAQLEQQRRAVVSLTRNAYLGIHAAISRVVALRQAVVSNTSALEAVQAGYTVGTRTSVDVLDAQRQLYQATRDLSRARYDYVLALLTLKQASGQLALADLDRVNGWLH